ncbi:MAG TPA: transcriptional repressor LexA [Phycisphaerae bacterium]|jgi:repressor LexA|nr:transcriptional repressor LexA [Phycisphaerae bacterium]HOB76037.1 transcriptional repressor LexA [Phycisphaerae bacterium]HOJ54438.1 transcriptional repressor LexA [Phycisphaerae bacterium]HOL26247.1 transcriptional repressor LexA [Phycisphaerae bacterium]HPP20772.1 transcriptional repressor LexA [Phycisphaerae bacterium]
MSKTKDTFRRLTPKQMRILMLVRDYQRKHGYSPTMQEIADVLGITKVTVFEHVSGLEKKGLLRRSRHRARSLELTQRVEFPDESGATLPLVGHIAAGSPIEAIENPETIELDSLFKSSAGVYALRVRGDSMIDEHIRDGDLVVVERRETARDGETVVALLDDGEATLKKFYREGKKVRLQPANPAYAPIYVDNIRIQGVVVGVLRRYH